MAKGKNATFTKSTGKKVINRAGQERRLLNPAQKGRKYAVELSTGKEFYNGTPLTNTQKAHRSGYLKARQDSANCFNAKNKKK